MELSARLRGREEKEFTFINYHPLVRNDKPSHPLEIANCLSSFPHDMSFVNGENKIVQTRSYLAICNARVRRHI